MGSAVSSYLATHCLIERNTGQRVSESTPLSTTLRAAFLYNSWPGRLLLRLPITWWLLNIEHKRLAKWASSPGSKKAIKSMIKTYRINPDDAERPVEQYATMQDFFTRELKAGARPIKDPDDPSVAVLPADCRVVVYPSVQEATRLWIKGSHFSVPALLGPGYRADDWGDAAIAVTRLSPADCHRLHAPVPGRVARVTRAGRRHMASLWVAVHSAVDVMVENERLVMLFETERFGPVAMAMIGASDVGSVQPLVKEGATVRKGDEVGVFAFGGSIVVTAFQRGAIAFDADLAANSARRCETRANMGSGLGRAAHARAPAAAAE
ncbi:phosphatidylserine decarboxylase [Raphidocelis subcapitata]|uniref:Phosphatidylserine decarboxylase n=1 Tax=Raphidocelis subcapitata TaxID=307507 RepID=A0A2V0P8F8_9CHLO|nr:phosphatidylserine decarboxylase [Raphidocelis subcapitata]|eukprot:GBF95849.1 phosphatidylserine decarboxylase [Raphidocelis subcapitata]